MLNIFIGSHGTGKSLLLKVLKNEIPSYTSDGFSRPIHECESLSVFQRQAVINRLTLWAFKNYLEVNINVFSARSIIDAIIYTELFFPDLSDEKKEEIGLKDLYENLSLLKSKNIRFFYIPIEFKFVDDGVRYSEVLQKKIDEKILSFIHKNNIYTSLITGSIEERKEKVLKLINS